MLLLHVYTDVSVCPMIVDCLQSNNANVIEGIHKPGARGTSLQIQQLMALLAASNSQ